MKSSNKIPGGKSDNLTKAKIAQKFGKSENYIKQQMIKGAKIELEHTDDFGLAQQIALNHISQFPDYYQRLDTMEKQAQKQLQSLNESDLSIDDSIKLSNVVLHIPALKEYYSKNKLRLSSDFFLVLNNNKIGNDFIIELVNVLIDNFKSINGFFDYSIEESNAILSAIKNDKQALITYLIDENIEVLTNFNFVDNNEIEPVVDKSIVKLPKIKYIAIDKKTYATDKSKLHFEVEINGKKAKGYWSPYNSYNIEGVDIDELEIGDYQTITIFSAGGGNRFYEMRGKPVKLEKQPKDLSFTGPYYSTLNLGTIFKEKIINAINGNFKANLSNEFLRYFKLI